MALPPLPEHNTARYWAAYTVGGYQHRLMMRVATGMTAGTASSVFGGLFGLLDNLVTQATVDFMEFAPAGSNIRNTVGYTGPATFGTGVTPAGAQASQLSFVGRSLDGRKARIFLYAFKGTFPVDFRLTPIESIDTGEVCDFLEEQSNAFLSISGQQPTWHRYANVGVNDHYVKRSRG